MNIKFSPPDITNEEIESVIEALKSGWITTGPKTKQFERVIAEYCGVNKAVALNSATAGLELLLYTLGIGKGDEVITSAYTYTASASVIAHVGAKIVLVDTLPNSYEIDISKIEKAITPKTKAIIPVDIGGELCDYDALNALVKSKSSIFSSNNEFMKKLGRIAIISDAAHSFGAKKNGIIAGQFADFTVFSLHAVKNLTTAEGGIVVWKLPFDADEQIYQQLMLWSLHGQNKDALSKTKPGAWEYDIKLLGYKCNMTDILASIGLVQLKRYDGLLKRRHEVVQRYIKGLGHKLDILKHENSSCHLMLTRVPNIDEAKRNEIIESLAQKGVPCNVHYKPLPMHTAYKNLDFDIKSYPNAYNQYKNEISLPLHTLLTNEEVDYIIEQCLEVLQYVPPR